MALALGLLLLLNALVLPYRGLFHDARLYAAQLKEHLEPGSMRADLYLRYGSQDSYSVFSLVLLPLYLQTLMGYPAYDSGLALSPRGIGALLFTPLAGHLTTKMDPRRACWL